MSRKFCLKNRPFKEQCIFIKNTVWVGFGRVFYTLCFSRLFHGFHDFLQFLFWVFARITLYNHLITSDRGYHFTTRSVIRKFLFNFFRINIFRCLILQIELKELSLIVPDKSLKLSNPNSSLSSLQKKSPHINHIVFK